MFFNFWAPFFKMNIFEVVTFFLNYWLSNQPNFSVATHIYNFHVFDEAYFLLTIRMPIATKLFRVMTYCRELLPEIYMITK